LSDDDVFCESYIHKNRNKCLIILLMTVFAVAMVLITLGFGVYNISVTEAIGVFFDKISGKAVDFYDELYVWDTRLPRAIGALAVGVALSVAGAVMQNDLHNPLAEPYTMGISSGAFLGALISMIYGMSVIPFITGDAATVVNAFVFSLIPILIIVIVSHFRKMSSTMIILVGVAVMFMFSSICQVIMVSAPSESLSDAYNWRVGTLARVTWDNLPVMVVFAIAILAVMMLLSRKLDVMYAGDRSAGTMGVNANRLRISTLVMASFATAAVVSFTGTIGFIGLVGPHVARMFVGSSNRYLIPASAAFGGMFVLLADTVAKVSGVNGLPVGVISAMIGGPLFVYILIKRGKSVWM
jgi:iron complex transport system permease protein